MAAALLAVVGAASESSTSQVTANSTVESVVVSVVLTILAFTSVVVLAAVVAVRASRRRGGEGEQEEARATWLQKLTALLVAIGMALLLAYLLRHGVTHPGPRVRGAPLRRPLKGAAHGKSVPLNATAAGITAGLLGIGLVLLLAGGWAGRQAFARRRLGELDATQRDLHPAIPERAWAPAPAPGKGAAADPAAEPDPRRAILLAYERFDALMAARGSPRAEQETPLEFSARLGSEPAPAAVARATTRLTELFGAARYGGSEMTDEDRSAALHDLSVITGRLPTAGAAAG